MSENIYEIEGDKFLKSGDNESAISAYTKAIKKDPKNVKLYLKRGVAEDILSMVDKRNKDYNKVLKLAPNTAEFYYVQSRFNYFGDATKNMQELISYADKALELEPNYAEVYNWRAFLKREIKDYTSALADHDKAIQLIDNHYYFYFLRGETRANLKDFAGAVQDYSKAIEINPEYATSYHQRGKALKEIGDKTSAKEDFKTAKELGYASNFELVLVLILPVILLFIVIPFIDPYLSKIGGIIEDILLVFILWGLYIFFFILVSKCIKKLYFLQ